jgi:D-alanine--poly(phosphoribitol) ligase subunit 1
VRRYAAAFAARGATRIMIALPQGTDAYAAMLGAGLAGGYYAPLNVSVPVDKLRRIVARMRPEVLVAEPAMAAALLWAYPECRVLHPEDLPVAAVEGRGTRHELAYVIFTSGTTGTPKGVMIPRVALDHFVAWVSDSGFITPTDRVAQFSNIAFDVSVTDIYGSLCLGACLHPAVGRSDRMFPARFVAREKITVWNSTPSVLSLMMQAGEVTEELLGSLRLINTCGEPLLRAHVECFFGALPAVIMQNSYGPTETTVTMTELRLDRSDYGELCDASVAIGPPIANMTVDLVGGPHADEGEIVITGPQVAAGYWEDPERTAAAFKMWTVDGQPERAYFSGDWAYRRDGHVFCKARIDRQIKLHGHRLELDEVAKAIQDAGFPIACVLKWHEELAAVIEHRAEAVFDESALRGALAKVLETHAIPTVIRVIERMPRSANDKLDRAAVVEWLDAEVVI